MFYNIKSIHLNYIYKKSKISLDFSLDNNIKANNIKTFNSQGLKVSYSITKQNDDYILEIALDPESKIIIKKVYLVCNVNINNSDKIFLNGFQSWTQSKEYSPNEKISPLNNLFYPFIKYYRVKNFGDSSFYKYPNKRGRLHGYSYSYIKNSNNHINFIGSLDEKNAYTIFEYDTNKDTLLLRKDIKKITITKKINIFKILFSCGDENKAFENYFSKQNITKHRAHYATGWTSWYNYYTNISEKIVLENLNSFSKRKIPIDFFQIDDGYQKAIGDWLDIKKTFPNGMKYIADKIKQSNIKPGIWIAPFICQKRSNIFKEHSDWIIKNSAGKPFKLGYSKGYWDDSFYPLDFYNSQVKDYIKKVLSVIVNDWGYEIVKIDFLYALTFINRDDKSRATIMHEAALFLRECIGEKFILGCGSPLATVFGVFDYCRIGSDVALQWEDILTKDFIRYRERVSCANSLLSTIGRRHLNNRAFLNDPDVYILREENNNLTDNQKYSLYILNQIFGGLVFTSDNIDLYSKNILRLYLSQFPFLPKKNILVENKNKVYKITFSIKNQNYVTYFNFSNKENDVSLDEDAQFFYNVKILQNKRLIKLLPYQTICLLEVSKEPFTIVGSNLHIFPGSEIVSCKHSKNNIQIVINKQNKNNGYILISVPQFSEEYTINKKKLIPFTINGLNIIKYLVK